MKNNDNEDIKVIKFNNNNNIEDQKSNVKSEAKTENQYDNNENGKAKRKSKLRAQRTKAPKVYLQNQKKGGFSSLFSCCLPGVNDNDDDDN